MTANTFTYFGNKNPDSVLVVFVFSLLIAVNLKWIIGRCKRLKLHILYPPRLCLQYGRKLCQTDSVITLDLKFARLFIAFYFPMTMGRVSSTGGNLHDVETCIVVIKVPLALLNNEVTFNGYQEVGLSRP